jgi:hypothetical protein
VVSPPLRVSNLQYMHWICLILHMRATRPYMVKNMQYKLYSYVMYPKFLLIPPPPQDVQVLSSEIHSEIPSKCVRRLS